jgi:phosphoglycolate phosphatase-like HAD superfamily hydrolase
MLDFIADKKIGKVYYVGDTIIDIECGKNVKELYPNIKTIGVTWCKTTKEEFSKNNAEYVVDKPEELLKVIK